MKKPVDRSKKMNQKKVKIDFFKTAILNSHAVYLTENPSLMLQKKIKDFFEETISEYYSSHNYFTFHEETCDMQSDLAEKLHDEIIDTFIPNDFYKHVRKFMFEFYMLEAMACSERKCFEITESFLEKQNSSIILPEAMIIILLCKKIAIKGCENESMTNQVGRFLYNQVHSAYSRLATPPENSFAELLAMGYSPPLYEEDCERLRIYSSLACPSESVEIYPAINAAFVTAHNKFLQSLELNTNENEADASTKSI